MITNVKRILYYRLNWFPSRGAGEIVLVMEGNQEHTLTGLPTQSYGILVDVLRNERPLYWDEAAGAVRTGNEIVGEEEMD